MVLIGFKVSFIIINILNKVILNIPLIIPYIINKEVLILNIIKQKGKKP